MGTALNSWNCLGQFVRQRGKTFITSHFLIAYQILSLFQTNLLNLLGLQSHLDTQQTITCCIMLDKSNEHRVYRFSENATFSAETVMGGVEVNL